MTEFETLQPDFERDGFIHVEGFLAGSALDELQRELDRYIRVVVPGLASEHAFYEDRDDPATLKQMQHMQLDPYFEEYTNHPRWHELAEALLGEPTDCQGPEWFNKPPGTDHVTPPHQDNFYFCLKPAQVVTIWLALDPIDVANGCLRYVRGSHQSGIREHLPSKILGFSQALADYGPADEQNEVALSLKPGDAVVHHGNTVHRADPNHSNRHRRAFAMVLRGQSCQRDQQAYDRYLQSVQLQHRMMGLP